MFKKKTQAAKGRGCALFSVVCVSILTRRQGAGGVSVDCGDNARPPCKAWKWEEKEEGSAAAPASPPGGYREPGDGEGRWGHGGPVWWTLRGGLAEVWV